MIGVTDSTRGALARSWVERSPPRAATSSGNVAENPTSKAKSQLSAAETQRLRALQQSDRRVRAHELAHVAAGGSLVRGGASFSYETGPDGVSYAVAGEVSIDSSPGRTPQETLAKAERVRAAALAPADPSAQDRQVAVLATRMAMEAALAIALQKTPPVAMGREWGSFGRSASGTYPGLSAAQTATTSGRGSAVDVYA